jgi:phage terminase large subunit-like protein
VAGPGELADGDAEPRPLGSPQQPDRRLGNREVKNDQAIRIWASQHLNIEMGVGMKTDGWAGAEYWAQGEDESITLETILDTAARS